MSFDDARHAALMTILENGGNVEPETTFNLVNYESFTGLPRNDASLSEPEYLSVTDLNDNYMEYVGDAGHSRHRHRCFVIPRVLFGGFLARVHQVLRHVLPRLLLGQKLFSTARVQRSKVEDNKMGDAYLLHHRGNWLHAGLLSRNGTFQRCE